MVQGSPSVNSVSRVANRVKREAIARLPPVRRLDLSRHERRIRQWEPHRPALDASRQRLVETLDRNAITMQPLDDLGVPGTEDVKAELERLTSLLAADTAPRTSTTRPPQAELLRDVRLWRWGLDDGMLDIVENYLGQPARYYGADVRREVADGRPAHDVRQWHRDIEDHRVFKILVWLNDVGPDGGPFAHVPVDRSLEAVQRLRYVAGFVGDDAMRGVVPESEWRKCTGPRWTAVMPDTARLFHRATPPAVGDRYSVTFTWTSRHPVKTMPAPIVFSAEETDRIKQGLTPRQLACLPRAMEA